MKHINTYANISEFANPEVGRVLHANGLIASPTHSTYEELATIKSLNPEGEYSTGYFYDNKVITQFPELQYCTGLTDLSNTFWKCSSLIKAPVIPSSVTNLRNTFYKCSSLTTIGDIPEGVTNMNRTFEDCSSLTTIGDIPEGVTDLSYAFFGCSNLTTAPTIPSSVTDLRSTFSGCYRLTKAPVIPSSVINLGSTFWGCSSLLEAPVIPEGVTNLQHTFYGCSRLLEAPVIPEGVIDLYDTFNGCSSLLEAPVIPSSVKYMRATFRDCSNLLEAPIIPEGVTDLSETFRDCSRIDGIYIVNAKYPPIYFYSLSNVQAIFVPNDSMQPYFEHRKWTQFTNRLYPMSEYIFEVSGKFADPEVGRVLHANGLIASPTHSSIEELATIKSLSGVFYENKVITQFPELQYCTGLTDLNNAFRGCSKLTEVPVIPEGVRSLSYTFLDCTRLTTAPALPNSATSLFNTFSGCTSLTSTPVIPKSVTNMEDTFNGCTGLDGILAIEAINPPTINNGTFLNVTMVAIYVPDESVQLYKEALGWIDFADRIYPMSEYTFEVSGKFADPEVGRVLHANGLIANANKSSIEELATIKTLNPKRDYSNTGYFYNNKIITQFPELQYCTGLTNLDGAFAGCSNLTTVGDIVPDGLTDLYFTFSGCTNLTTAPIIPEGVTSLSYTFLDCTSLLEAPVIPSSVTTLNSTFAGCTSIDGIYIINAVEPPTHYATLPRRSVQAIYVPNGSVYKYKSADGWSYDASKIYPMSEAPFQATGIFADPEVGRVLHANGLIASPTHSTREELATIKSLNPGNTSTGSYFYNNKTITQFPELQYCTGLISLAGAFRECSNLTTVGHIPSRVTNLSYTFDGCSSLTTAPVIPKSVTNMQSTFAGCVNLTKAPTIPSSVNILNRTFLDCSSIDGIYIINIVTPVTYSNSLSNIQAVYVPYESVDAYKSASGWIQFADKIYPMFADPEVGRILHAHRLIASPTHSSIEELATIKTLNPSGEYNTGYFYNNKVITQFPELQYCTGLINLYGAFRDCLNLTTVGDIIPEGVTDLGNTFNGCYNLATAPTIPSSVKYMYATFEGCSRLTKAPVIPSSVTNLSETFRDCTIIDGIYIINAVKPPTYFYSLSNTQAIYVPNESIQLYKEALGWIEFADKIYPMSDKP